MKNQKSSLNQTLLSSSSQASYSSIDQGSSLKKSEVNNIRKREIDSNRSSSSTSLAETISESNPNTKDVIENSINQPSIFSHKYWQSNYSQYSTSVYLENKGSVARDHLANERTYLAWLRTSLSTISVGIGLTQLFRLEKAMLNPNNPTSLIYGQIIGLIFVVISVVFLAFGFIRYFHAQVAMTKGYFPASRSTVIATSGLLLTTMTLIVVYVSSQ